jgi:hypothetical protein
MFHMKILYADTAKKHILYINNEVKSISAGGINCDLRKFWVTQKIQEWNRYISHKLSVM